MDPATIITSALAAGVAALSKGALESLTSVASNAVKEAYDGIKTLIARKYSKVNVVSLEENPSSRNRQEVVKEDLVETDAVNDAELVTQARALLKIINEHAPKTIQSVSGVSFEELDAGGDILVENIRTGKGSSVSAKDFKTKGRITIRGISAGLNDEIVPRRADTDRPESPEEISRMITGIAKLNAGGDIQVHVEVNKVKNNLIHRVEPHATYLADPREPWDVLSQPTVSLSELREALRKQGGLKEPILISVRGTFFPAALLTSGWWEKHARNQPAEPNWRVPLQKWLYHGFHEWAPSWAFCWEFDGPPESLKDRYFIGQLADGDEANSIPVLMNYDKAKKVYDKCMDRNNWGGMEAEIKGLLGHRSHFPNEVVAAGVLGDSLDYCLKLLPDDCNHKFMPLTAKSDLYSGYLWECVAPKAWITPHSPIVLDQVFFIWEHTDFTKADARKYNLESLRHKHAQIEKQFGELVLLQKSCTFIDGAPLWSGREFHEALLGRTEEII